MTATYSITQSAETALAVMMDLGRTVWPENGSLQVQGAISDRIHDMLARNKAAIIQALTVTTEMAPLVDSEATLYHLMGRRWMLLQEMETGGSTGTPRYERTFYWFRIFDIMYRRIVNKRMNREAAAA